MIEPLAHSARDGCPEQSYREHVGNVIQQALRFGREATAYCPSLRAEFLASLELAATYHDLGKLDDFFQDDLRRNRRQTRINHVDAGVAHLLNGKHAEAVVAAYSHHRGLPSIPAERAKNANELFWMFRDADGMVETTGQKVLERTAENLSAYLAKHHEVFLPVDKPSKPFKSGLQRRLLLSCLVDADHSDTARHYGKEAEECPPQLLAAARLEALDRYVSALSASAVPRSDREHQRQALRDSIYQVCRSRPVDPGDRVLSCDSPVGTGKTTAIMAHLLRTAKERKLRRIFVVLPFTNIIDQSVGVYRRALRLSVENSDSMPAVVAAHHHRADFSGERSSESGTNESMVYSGFALRRLATRWESPVVVTTAVQFFETLAACQTKALRKLHQVPGSAIFIDEAHAAMPAALWPQMWRWLLELCDEWGCHLVLASGSLTRFWELPEFVPEASRRLVPEIILGDLREQSKAFESKRVQIRTSSEQFSFESLADFVTSRPGPRLIIFNTVQSAAVFAHYLRFERMLGLNVEHVSTALTPRDRAVVVGRISRNLAAEWKDWTLVATSCVEAGVDFSFRTAFRESWGLANLLQIAGRASRSAEYADTEVWDFRHDSSEGLCLHPQAEVSRRILAELFQRCANEGRPPSDADCTEALRREVRDDRGVKAARMKEIADANRVDDYPEVARLCRLIDAPTRTIVVEPDLIARLESPNRKQWPAWQEVMLGSVQVWPQRVLELPVRPIGDSDELWALIDGNYDGFLGWMKGVIPLIESRKLGGFIL